MRTEHDQWDEMRWRWRLPGLWGHLREIYLPWTLSRWTVLSVDDTGHLRPFFDDDLFLNLILAAVERFMKRLSGVNGGGDVWLSGGGVLPVVPENSSGVFLDDSTAPEGLCKRLCQLWRFQLGLWGQSCGFCFSHRWSCRIYRPMPGSIRRHTSTEHCLELCGKSVRNHRCHSRIAAELLQTHRWWPRWLKKWPEMSCFFDIFHFFTDFTVEALVARKAKAGVAADSVFAASFVCTRNGLACVTVWKTRHFHKISVFAAIFRCE